MVFRGLRVRMGVHTDTVTSYRYDQLSHQHRYSGPLMDIASQVSDTAAGGQILVTQATVSSIQSIAHLSSKRFGPVAIIHEGRHFLSEPDIEELDTYGHFRRLLALEELGGLFNQGTVSQQGTPRSALDGATVGGEPGEGDVLQDVTGSARAPVAEARESLECLTGRRSARRSGPAAEGIERDTAVLSPSPAEGLGSATAPISALQLPAESSASLVHPAATEPLTGAMTMAASFEFASVPTPLAPHLGGHAAPGAAAAMRSASSDVPIRRAAANSATSVLHDASVYRPPPPVLCPRPTCDIGSPHSSVMLTPLRVCGASNACSEESHNFGSLAMMPGMSTLSTAASDFFAAEVRVSSVPSMAVSQRLTLCCCF